MSFSSNFEVKATLYFRVHDAELYGGPGTVGFAKQSFELIQGAKLEDLNDIMANQAWQRCLTFHLRSWSS